MELRDTLTAKLKNSFSSRFEPVATKKQTLKIHGGDNKILRVRIISVGTVHLARA